MKYLSIISIYILSPLLIKHKAYIKSENPNCIYPNNVLGRESVDSLKFATLFIYRNYEKGTSGKSYNIHIGDSVVCKVTNDSKCTVRLYKEGTTEIWAKTETKSSVLINVEFGNVYYLKCELRRGAFVIRPSIRIVSPERGEREFRNAENINN